MKSYVRVPQAFQLAAAVWCYGNRDRLEKLTFREFGQLLISEVGSSHGVTAISGSTLRKIAKSAGVEFVRRTDLHGLGNAARGDRYRRLARHVVRALSNQAAVVDALREVCDKIGLAYPSSLNRDFSVPDELRRIVKGQAEDSAEE